MYKQCKLHITLLFYVIDGHYVSYFCCYIILLVSMCMYLLYTMPTLEWISFRYFSRFLIASILLYLEPVFDFTQANNEHKSRSRQKIKQNKKWVRVLYY